MNIFICVSKWNRSQPIDRIVHIYRIKCAFNELYMMNSNNDLSDAISDKLSSHK